MKKQLRLVLFTALIMILVMMTALAASAATDGADVREEGHYYEVVSAADAATPKYYTTLAAAVGAVDADGYTITVLANVTEPGVVLDKAFTYTITGGAQGATVTFNATAAAGTSKVLFNVAAGRVTLDKLTVAYDTAAITAAPAAVAYISGACELTLNDFVTSAAVTDTVSLNAVATVTVSGASTSISGGINSVVKAFATKSKNSVVTVSGGRLTSDKFVVHMLASITLNVTGGTLTGGTPTGSSTGSVFYANANGSSTITVSNATIVSGDTKGVFHGVNAKHAITLLAGTKIYANNGTMFAGFHADATMELNGAELHLVGAKALLHVASAVKVTITSIAGSVLVEDGASMPAEILDKTETQKGFDWTKLSLTVTSITDPCEITAGEYTITSLADNVALAKVGFIAANAARFPNLAVGAELDCWVPLILNGADAVLNISTLEVALNTSLVVVKAGTLNITGGTYELLSEGCVIDHQGGTVNISGGTFKGVDLPEAYILHSTAAAESAINITGGSFAAFGVVKAEGVVTVTITDGSFAPVDESKDSITLHVNHESAKLNVTGGNFANMSRAVWMTAGDIAISGGKFKIGASVPCGTVVGSLGTLLYVDGAVKLAVSGDADFGLVVDENGKHTALFVSANAADAEINISGGSFGSTDMVKRTIAYCVYVAGAITNFNITGGTFYGGTSQEAIRLSAAGAVLNISGTTEIYSYRNVRIRTTATVNISGGSFNPVFNGVQANSLLLHVLSGGAGSELNITGGNFNDYMTCITLEGACEVNVTGGTFTERTVGTSTKEAFAYITAAATFRVGANENGEGPVINLGRSESADGTTHCSASAFLIPADKAAVIEISGGTFNIVDEENIIFNIAEGSVKKLEITGGTFFVSGEESRFLPDEIFDVEGTTCVVTGATVNLSYGAYLPIYKYIDASGLKLVVSGKYYVKNPLVVSRPYAGEDNGGKGYVISDISDVYQLMQNQFASFTVQGNAICASGFIPFDINGEGVVVTLQNFTDSYDKEYLIRVTKGTLNVIGGSYAASAGESIFEVLSDNAALNITGGFYNIKGTFSYMIRIADGVTDADIAVANASMQVAQFGNVPLQVAFDVTAEALKINGLSELILNEAKEYTISSFADIEDYVTEILSPKFPNMTVDVQTWIPLHLNNAGADLIIAGGVYEASVPFMFKITAGDLVITGGKFTNDLGDIIQVVGDNVTVSINLPDNADNGMYAEGRMILAKNASNLALTITSGRFVEIAPDTANDQTEVLFFLDEGVSATVTVDGGYFEASRVLLINNVTATVTINGGTFVSNQIVDGESITARATNAHMLAPCGTGAVLVINGGSFDNKQGNFIIAPSNGANITISGGSFNGGAGWFLTDTATTLVINANADPAKSPVFTDTEGYGDGNYYIASTHANASITINAGTFVGGVSNEYILYAPKGTWNINGGTFDGSLFYITTASKVTVGGGTYTASGAGAKLFDLVGAITSDNLNITVDLATKVEDGASILETTLARASALALLSRVTYTVNGSARLGTELPLTQNEIWSTPADQQHLIKEYFGDAISFGETGTYSLILKGNYTITITGDDTWEFHGGDFLKLIGVPNLIVMDGTFIVTGGDIFNLSGGACEVLIGNATDATVKPQFVVGAGGNVLQLNNASGAFNAIIYNGSFIKGEYIDGVLTPVIDYSDYTGPLFYLEGGAKDNSKLVIVNGYYEATRILMDYLSNAEIEIYNGTFKSNYIAENLSAEHYGEDGITPIIDNKYDLFHMRGTAPFTVYGGDFDGGLGRAIFALEGQGGGTWSFVGGTFTGGYYWIYANQHIDINISNTRDGDDNVIAIPTFTAPTTYTKYGIFSDTAKAGSATWSISGGSFSMKDYTGRMMLVPKGNITVKISGGEFTVTRGNVYDADQQLQNDTVVLYVAGGADYTVNTDITGGTFRAALIIAYTKVGGTLNIYGGKFTSNSLSIDGSFMLNIGNNKAVFNIYGGTFTGNSYTAAILYAATASGGTQTVNIYGGTFNMGDRWIHVSKPTIITIDNGSYVNENGDTVQTSPVFSGLSDGAGADVEKGEKVNYASVGFYVGAVGAVLDIKGGSFKTAASQPFTMFDLRAGNVTVYPGVVMESGYRIFTVPRALRGDLVIKGGTFTGVDACDIFYLATAQKYYDATPYNAEIVIEGGTFNAMENATVFNMVSPVKEYKFIIKDGTFTSADSRLFIADGMATQFVIEGGKFSSGAARMFFIDNNTTPLVIKNGTFTFEEKIGGTDHALVYVVGKAAASIEIQGGIFIDNRRGSAQSFLKMNKRATVSFTGPFELYTLELKDNFYYDYDDNSKSLSMDNCVRAELDGVLYNHCFGYYHRYAPNVTVAPTLRPVLGTEGIVYTASVSAEVAEYLKSLGTVTYGTLIFPTEYMGSDGWQGDTDFLAELKAFALDNGRPEGTVYTIVNAVNGIVTEADGSITFRAALINLKESNYTRSMTGIAFAKVTAADGTETYYYASHVSAGISSNMRKIVSAALKDVNSKPVEENGRVYCYAAIMKKNSFSRYPTVLQDYLRKYLPENQRTPKY